MADTTTALARKPDARVANVRDMLERSKSQIKLALPKHVAPERMLRIVMTSVQKTPALLDCTPQSLIGAVIAAAQLGLEPDTGLGHAYLVPYGKAVTLIIGYRGMIDLSRRSGQLSTISARAVHERDVFQYSYGLEEKLHHVPSTEADPGALVAVYAVARLKDGGVQMEVMSRAQVDAIRTRSRAGSSGPWKSDFEEMAKKTVLRRLFKMLPVSIEMVERAIEVDTAAEMGLPQDVGGVIDTDAHEEASATDAEPQDESGAGG